MPTTPIINPNLEYHGRPLIDQPRHGGTSVQDVAYRLVDGQSVSVLLEPGDGTRYCFTIAAESWPETGWTERLAVVRSSGHGGDYRSAALLPDPQESETDYFLDEIVRLADGNDWTASVFAWWFAKLWAAIVEEEADARFADAQEDA